MQNAYAYYTQAIKVNQILGQISVLQHAQRDLARNHSGPTSVKSRKCRRN